jgi:hypothetical protein
MKKFIFISGIAISLMGCNPAEKNPVTPVNPKKKDTATVASLPASHYTVPDLSPLDIIYYPSDYPLKKMSGNVTAGPLARIIYSRPQTQKRNIFGALVKYNEPWRLGANESTEIEFFSTATIQNKTIKPGRYILYCIPQETKWTLVLNANLYSWGLKQDRQKDLMQFDIPVEKNNTVTEYFTMAFEGNEKNADLIILWDLVKTRLPIKFQK